MNALHHARKAPQADQQPQTTSSLQTPKLKNRFGEFPDEICIEDKIDGGLRLIRPYKNVGPKMPKVRSSTETAQAGQSNAHGRSERAENGWEHPRRPCPSCEASG